MLNIIWRRGCREEGRGGTRGQTIRCNNITMLYIIIIRVRCVYSSVRARDSVAENRNHILILINPKARCGVIA